MAVGCDFYPISLAWLNTGQSRILPWPLKSRGGTPACPSEPLSPSVVSLSTCLHISLDYKLSERRTVKVSFTVAFTVSDT